MGAIPNKLPGFQDIERDHEARARFEQAWGATIQPALRLAPDADVRGDGAGRAEALYVVGENPAQSEADAEHTLHLLEGLDHLVVQDIFLTRTAELADVVLPASASWCEAEGTVTNSERRVQRVRKALDPPGQARDDIEIVCEHRRAAGPRLGPARRRAGLGRAALALADARRHDLPAARGARRDPVAVLGRGASRRAVPARPAVGEPVAGPPAPFNVVEHELPVDELSDEFPIRLTTGRRLDSYNTGVQSGGYRSPLRRRRVARPLARGLRAARRGRRRARSRSPRGAARSSRRSGSTTPCARAWRS